VRRLITVLSLSGALVAGSTGQASAAADLTPPPIPTTGNPEVQFVGAGASPGKATDNESLVSAVVVKRADDIYNVAVASNNPNGAADANGLRSVAAALQIALVKGHPTSVSPVNGAYAYNNLCTSCFSYAFARQKVVYVSEDFQMSRDVRARVARISASVAHAVRVDTSAEQLDSDLAAQFSQLDAVVSQAVQDQGESQSGEQSNHSDRMAA
jgi:hypothetical protein